MCCCVKCCKIGWGVVVLIAGLLLLLKDIGIWAFWNITPWTIVFVLVGLAMVCKGLCKCKECSEKKKK
ncbi:MAG: hypothetical protein N3D84_02035 [Candidatus Woesearchaeota archaeon]|nr:hypothetical protein [Candidatus Woesearchaeota archaeon]